MTCAQGDAIQSWKNEHLYLAQDNGRTKRIGKMPENAQGIVAQYREHHHRIAQMVAAGCTPNMIRVQTGVSTHRLTLYLSDPSFIELIAGYAKRQTVKIELAADSYHETALANMLRAEQQIADHLDASEETGELLPISQLDRISQGRADRFGYSKHSVVKHEHDFAAALDKAIARSGKVIEHQPNEARQAPTMLELAATQGEGAAPAKKPPPRQPASFAQVLEIKRRRLA